MLRNVALLVVLVSGCADAEAPAVAATATAEHGPRSVTVTVGAEGGVVELPGGPRLVVAPGSLASPRAISITQLGDNFPVGGVSPAFTFSPHDIVFARPATITFPVAQAAADVDITWRMGAQVAQLDATVVGGSLRGQVDRLGTAHLAQRAHTPVQLGATHPRTQPRGLSGAARAVAVSCATGSAAHDAL